MADYIRMDELRVSCNIPMNQILSLSIHEGIGIHTKAEVKAVLEPDSLKLSEEEFNSQPILIHAFRNGQKQQIFSGVMKKVRIEKEAGYDTITILAYSLSWLMDLEKKSRSFQVRGKTILDLMKEAGTEDSFDLKCSVPDQALKEPFIQYQETNWEFLMRLSTHLKAPVFVANEYEGRGIYIGFEESAYPVEINAIHERWAMGSKPARSEGWGKWEDTYYEILTDQVLHVGQCAAYGNGILWVRESDMVLRQGVLKCTCRLTEKQYNAIQTAFNPHISGFMLMGTVLAREGETIKIHFDMDEEQDIQSAYPYPWLPEYGNMLYCMPEKGEQVRLLIPDGDERHAVGINCIRQNSRACGETQSADERWFVTDHKKKMALLPSQIQLSADCEESQIAIRDGSGEHIFSKGPVLVQAKGKLGIYGTRVELRAPKEITAIKRQLGTPAVLNICHNLDSMGTHTTFEKVDVPKRKVLDGKASAYGSKTAKPETVDIEKIKKEKEKLKFKLQELLSQADKENACELEPSSIVAALSAIPQGMEADRLSRIAMGFRPISG